MSREAGIQILAEDRIRDAHAEWRMRADLVAELAQRKQARRERLIDGALQLAIAVMTLAALWLITSTSPMARWGHVIGLLSQPLYMAATLRARQWGMFAVAVMLCGVWARGIANYFL